MQKLSEEDLKQLLDFNKYADDPDCEVHVYFKCQDCGREELVPLEFWLGLRDDIQFFLCKRTRDEHAKVCVGPPVKEVK